VIGEVDSDRLLIAVVGVAVGIVVVDIAADIPTGDMEVDEAGVVLLDTTILEAVLLGPTADGLGLLETTVLDIMLLLVAVVLKVLDVMLVVVVVRGEGAITILVVLIPSSGA
jgi:hypothetical protein